MIPPRLFAASLPLLLALACSAEKPTPPPVSAPPPERSFGASNPRPDGGQDSGSDAATPRDAATPLDAGGCLPGTVGLGMDGAFGGTLAVAGTVTFPVPLEPGSVLVLSIAASAGTPRAQTFAMAALGDRVTYRIGGLVSGSYVIRVQADATRNGLVNDTGDYDGYYDGSATGPLLTRADARTVVLQTTCIDRLDFGVGVKF